MPTITFSLSSFTNRNADLKAGATFSAYASGAGVANAFVTAARLTLNNIRVYSSQCYLEVGKGSGAGRTAVFAQDSNVHNERVSLTSFANLMAQSGEGTASFTVRASSGSTGNLINLRDNVSGTLELDYFIPVSGFTMDTSEIILLNSDVDLTVTVTPAHSGAYHYLEFLFQTPFKTYSLNHYDTDSHTAPFNKVFTIDDLWLDAIPNSESGIAIVTLQTYINGSMTGSVTQQVLIKAHADVKPTIAGFTDTRIPGIEPATWGVYVQGYSRVRLSASGVNGIKGSTISEIVISGGGYSGTVTRALPVYETGVVNLIGNVTFTCTVKDSRQHTNTASVTVTYKKYAQPRITSLTAVRCNSDGDINSSGEYAKLIAAYSFEPVDGKNAIAGMITQHRLYTSASDDYISPALNTVIHASESPYVVGPGLDANVSYVVRVTLQDGITATQSTVVVPTQTWLLHYLKGGKGVAIGKVAEIADAFEINSTWDMYYKGQKLEDKFAGATYPVPWSVDKGGTGLTSVAAGSYLRGNGAGALVPTAPAQVLADIGGAAAGHNHNLVYAALNHNHNSAYASLSHGHGVGDLSGVLPITGGTLTGNLFCTYADPAPNYVTAFRTNIWGNAGLFNAVKPIRTDAAGIPYFTQYGSGLAWSTGDTHAFLHAAYNSPTIYMGGGNGQSINWRVELLHTGRIVPIENGGTAATTAAAARNNLGITPANLKVDWKTAYNFTTGCLMETPLPTTESTMFLLEIKGNGYGASAVIDINVQGYYYQPSDAFYNMKAVAKDLVIPIRVFKYNGKVWFWFKPPFDYITIWAYLRVWHSTENKIIAITHSAMLTSGVTLDNNVVPVRIFNSSEGNIVPLANGGTGASTGANACANIGAVKKSGDTMTGLLTISAHGTDLQLGSQGYGVTHYVTNGAFHYFNKQVNVAGDIYAGPSYDKKVYHQGNLTYGPGEPAGGFDGDIYLQHIS